MWPQHWSGWGGKCDYVLHHLWPRLVVSETNFCPGFVWKIRDTEIESSKDQKERVVFTGRVPRSTLKKLFQPILIPITRLQYLMAKVCKAVAEISVLIPSLGLMFAVYHCRPNLSKYINDVAYERKSWNNVDFLECCISLLCVTVMSEIRELYHARGIQILIFVRRGKLLEFGQNTKDIVPKFYEFTNNWLPFENMG